VPRPLVGIAARALMDETRDTADDQGDQINLTQQTFALDGRALLTLVGLSQEALKRTLRVVTAAAHSCAGNRRRAAVAAFGKVPRVMGATRCNGSFMLSAFSPGMVPACTFAGAAALASCPLFLSRVAFMFTVLRSVVIIGLIFYFSPARETGQREPGEDRKPRQTPPPSAVAEAQESAWNRLVGGLKDEAVRTVVNDKALSDKAFSAGVRMSENAARSLLAQPKAALAEKAAPAEKPRLAEADGAARAAQDPSVRCVYRCDGSE